MRPDQVSSPGPLTFESGALLTALHGLAGKLDFQVANLLLATVNFEPWD